MKRKSLISNICVNTTVAMPEIFLLLYTSQATSALSTVTVSVLLTVTIFSPLATLSQCCLVSATPLPSFSSTHFPLQSLEKPLSMRLSLPISFTAYFTLLRTVGVFAIEKRDKVCPLSHQLTLCIVGLGCPRCFPP